MFKFKKKERRKTSCPLLRSSFQPSARIICTSKVGAARHADCRLPEAAGVAMFVFVLNGKVKTLGEIGRKY